MSKCRCFHTGFKHKFGIIFLLLCPYHDDSNAILFQDTEHLSQRFLSVSIVVKVMIRGNGHHAVKFFIRKWERCHIGFGHIQSPFSTNINEFGTKIDSCKRYFWDIREYHVFPVTAANIEDVLTSRNTKKASNTRPHFGTRPVKIVANTGIKLFCRDHIIIIII